MINNENFVLKTSLKPFIVFEFSFELIWLLWDDDVVKIINTAALLLKNCLSPSHVPVLDVEAIKVQLGDNKHLLCHRRNLTVLQLNRTSLISPIYTVVAQRAIICQHLRNCYLGCQQSRHWNKRPSAVHPWWEVWER